LASRIHSSASADIPVTILGEITLHLGCAAMPAGHRIPE
jgi:hypothetical protein